MQMNVYDANNYFRMYLETDRTGRPVSKLFREIQQAPVDRFLSVIVWDGAGALASRRALFPDYKVGRTPASPEKYEHLDHLRQVLELSSAISIRVPGFEADDVLAHVVKRFKSQFDIIIHSNDADFAQLGVPMTRQVFKIEPRWCCLYKTLVGDPSDKIPGLAGFGEGAWLKLNDLSKRLLEEYVSREDFTFTREQLIATGIADKMLEKLMDVKTRALLNVYWKVVNFMEVPTELVDKHTIIGTNDSEAAEKIFEEFTL